MMAESEVGLTLKGCFFPSIQGRHGAWYVEGCWVGRAKELIIVEWFRKMGEGGLLLKGLRILGEGSSAVALSLCSGGNLVCCWGILLLWGFR